MKRFTIVVLFCTIVCLILGIIKVNEYNKVDRYFDSVSSIENPEIDWNSCNVWLKRSYNKDYLVENTPHATLIYRISDKSASNTNSKNQDVIKFRSDKRNKVYIYNGSYKSMCSDLDFFFRIKARIGIYDEQGNLIFKKNIRIVKVEYSTYYIRCRFLYKYMKTYPGYVRIINRSSDYSFYTKTDIQFPTWALCTPVEIK